MSSIHPKDVAVADYEGYSESKAAEATLSSLPPIAGNKHKHKAISLEQRAELFVDDQSLVLSAAIGGSAPPVTDDGADDGDAYQIEFIPAPEPDALGAWIERARNWHSASVGGHIIGNNQVCFTKKNGRISIMAPGRRRILDPMRRIVSTHNISEPLIDLGNLVVIWVQPGQIGLAMHNDEPALLGEGRHILEPPEWRFIGVQDAAQDELHWAQCPALRVVRVRPGRIALIYDGGRPKVLHSRKAPYHLVSPQQEFLRTEDALQDEILFDNRHSLDIVRVRPGNVGLAWEDSRPMVLMPNETPYELRAPRFQFVKIANQMDEVIHLDDKNSLDVVRVMPGKIGLYWENGKPRLLKARANPYMLMKPAHQFVRVVEVVQEHISLGSLHIITISTGRRGVIWEKGCAKIVEAGQMIFEEENFEFGGSHCMAEKEYELGPFRFVRVDAGEVGVKHTNGELDILYPGAHRLCTSEGETFHGFQCTSQQVMKIASLRVRTKDNVDIEMDAVLTYNIEDPQKAILGVKNLDEVLRMRAETTLSNIFSHTNYGEKGGKSKGTADRATAASTTALTAATAAVDEIAGIAASDSKEGESKTPAVDVKLRTAAVGVDQDAVHDEFMSSLQVTASEVWGVNLGDMSVDNVKVTNQELYHDLEQRAVTTVKTDTARANAVNEGQVDMIRAEAHAKSRALEAEGETAKLVATARANALVARAEAEAEAEAARILAEGRASALRLEAQAQAEAIVLKAEAEKKAQEMEAQGTEALGENALRLRMWEVQCRMAGEMYKNQRTFIDASEMPSMAQMLNFQAMNAFSNGINMPLVPEPEPEHNGELPPINPPKRSANSNSGSSVGVSSNGEQRPAATMMP